ncbi:MAG: hypothetical protein Q9167_002740, partial [Letrouitia subvulpina]
MAEGLPKGLITSNETVSLDIRRIDHVEVDDVARLWRVYSTNRAAIPDDVGRRLENLFWRIWSSGQILKRIRGRLVAAIFNKISEGGYIRTTPTQSPRSLGTFVNAHQDDADINASTSSVSRNGSSSPKEARSRVTVSTTRESGPNPTSILKKPGQGSPAQLSKSARILSPPLMASNSKSADSHDDRLDLKIPTPGLSDRHRPGVRDKPSPVNLPSSWRASTISGEDLIPEAPPFKKGTSSVGRSMALPRSDIPRQGQGNPDMGAKMGSDRKRPVMRHESSQSSSSGASNFTSSFRSRTSLLSSTQATTNTETSSKSAPPKRGESQNGRATFLPQRKDSTSYETLSEDEVSEDDTQESAHKVDAQLVDPDFRSKFVEKGRSARQPLTSVPLLREKVSEAAVAAASYQASGNLEFGHETKQDSKSEAVGDLPNEAHSLKGPSRQVAESNGGEQGLPRTKSQLTLLLKKDKKAKEEAKKAYR